MFTKLLATALTLSIAVPALAFSRQQACSCGELSRRISGLGYVVSSGAAGAETRQIQVQISQGRAILNSVRRMGTQAQEANCSRGNNLLDQEWSRWQPWVSQQGADSGDACFN